LIELPIENQFRDLHAWSGGRYWTLQSLQKQWKKEWSDLKKQKMKEMNREKRCIEIW